ncbi:hypothetical protein Pelo_8854 [Pelomyxa schiedti]|nr:hypothetical protein Pelo_8854 [Pelomyxa schiedti]
MNNRQEAQRIVHISRVVWEFVVVPFVTGRGKVHYSHEGRLQRVLDRPTGVWVLGLSEALFPLLALACRAVTGSGRVYWEKEELYLKLYTSRYYWLGCAAEAGSRRCVEWMLRRHREGSLGGGGGVGGAGAGAGAGAGNNEKECLAVLAGLKLLNEACRGGNVDSVRWATSLLGADRPWEFIRPFRTAMRRGYPEIIRWMADNTDVVESCRKLLTTTKPRERLVLDEQALKSGNLEVVKCWHSWFNHTGTLSVVDNVNFANGTKLTGSELTESLQWIKDRTVTKFRSTIQGLFGYIHNVDAHQWLLEAFSLDPTKETLDLICRQSAEIEPIQWLLQHFGSSLGSISVNSFIIACGNKHDSVKIPKFLLALPIRDCSIKHQVECLVEALACSNTSIADWLEETFHVMETVNATPLCTAETLGSILCKGKWSGQECIEGLKWFVSHANPKNFFEQSLPKAIEDARCHDNLNLYLALSNIFNIKPTNNLHATLSGAIGFYGLSDVKQLVSLMNFSASDVASDISESIICCVQSGKAVKWLVQEFNLTEEQIRMNGNHLLFILICSSKTKCTEWLIHKFNITLSEVATMWDTKYDPGSGISTKVSTWKMLLSLFPEMTPELVCQHFMPLATVTPLHIEHTMRQVGVTKEMVAEYFQQDGVDPTWETYLWLCSVLPSFASSSSE